MSSQFYLVSVRELDDGRWESIDPPLTGATRDDLAAALLAHEMVKRYLDEGRKLVLDQIEDGGS